MKIYDGRAEDIKIAYLGGGSRGWAWGLMSDLAAQEKLSGKVSLYDIDFQAAADNVIIGNKFNALPDAKSRWDYSMAETLNEALTGADFVVISILPGTFDEMESDVHAPEKYGIYQSVGDTVGPGGTIRAMRTLPIFMDFARGVRDCCPEAWVINYTNPMTLCIRSMYEAFPQIKAFGCCHEVFGSEALLIQMLEALDGVDINDFENLHVNVQGINHFTWIDKAYYRGEDIMKRYPEFVEKYYETGFTVHEADTWMNNLFESMNRVKFDLFKRYNLMAAAGDRHLAEFCPPWYLKDPETVREFKFGLTPVSWRKNDLANRRARSARLVSGEDSVAIHPTGEQGVMQMTALVGLGDFITNVNLPNRGQIPNLPLGCVVETNASFKWNQVEPVFAGPIKEGAAALVQRQVANQEQVMYGTVKKDMDIIFNAFANDPLMTASVRDARTLFNTMVDNTSKYLDYWKK